MDEHFVSLYLNNFCLTGITFNVNFRVLEVVSILKIVYMINIFFPSSLRKFFSNKYNKHLKPLISENLLYLHNHQFMSSILNHKLFISYYHNVSECSCPLLPLHDLLFNYFESYQYETKFDGKWNLNLSIDEDC